MLPSCRKIKEIHQKSRRKKIQSNFFFWMDYYCLSVWCLMIKRWWKLHYCRILWSLIMMMSSADVWYDEINPALKKILCWRALRAPVNVRAMPCRALALTCSPYGKVDGDPPPPTHTHAHTAYNPLSSPMAISKWWQEQDSEIWELLAIAVAHRWWVSESVTWQQHLHPSSPF